MPYKGKISPEEKMEVVEAYLDGEIGSAEIIDKYGIVKATFQCWVRLYKTRGPEGLIPATTTRKYAPELKIKVVEEYLRGGVSLFSLCEKYNISNHSMVQQWIKKYNSHEVSKPQYEGSDIMAKSRATSIEEREEIAQYCISQDKNYLEAAAKYHVSYAQVYNWVKKYEQQGLSGLEDRRGKRKPEEALTELELAKRKIKELENQLLMAKIRNDLLKQVRELEGRRR
jgi:transposase